MNAWMTFLSNLLLLLTVATLALGVGAYAAFKLRRVRLPRRGRAPELLDDPAPILVPYRPGGSE